jgi:hypothetical protein
MAALREEQAHDLAQLRAESEARVAEEEHAVADLESVGSRLGDESKRTAAAIEGDVDKEIEDMRARYESRLVLESKATLLLKGENGFMKRKFVAINKEMADCREESLALAEREKELLEAIAALHRDVTGHKKEIKEREETINEKEGRISELKKKNQELEKFKFVLNYKIQELKRQIMPKKKEIADMREQLKEMEMELLQYHKSNAALDLMIGELRLKRDGMSGEVRGLRSALAKKDEQLVEVGRDVQSVYQCVGDYKTLRASLTQLYRKFIYGDRASLALTMTAGGAAGAGGEKKSLAESLSTQGLAALPPGVNLEDLQLELTHQRQHLERGVDGMRKRIEKEAAAAAGDRARLLRENAVLTQEINDLRRDVKYLSSQLELTLKGGGTARATAQAQAGADATTGGGGLPSATMSQSGRRTTAAMGVTTGLKPPLAVVATPLTGARR